MVSNRAIGSNISVDRFGKQLARAMKSILFLVFRVYWKFDIRIWILCKKWSDLSVCKRLPSFFFFFLHSSGHGTVQTPGGGQCYSSDW